MRIEQLQYIIEVANTGSITLAADKLHVSQPNISHAISSFEKEVGAVIFNRTRAGTEPTEIGKIIIEQAHEIMHMIEELKKTALNHASLLTEKITIGAISGICTSFLPKTLSSFKAKYPNVELEIVEDNSGGIEEGILQGTIDLGLIGIPDEYDFKHLVAHKFLVCKMLACIGVTSPLANKECLSFYEIVKHPIIGSSEHMSKELRKYGTPKELFHSARSEAAKRVIAEGMATGFYMDISLKDDPYVTTGQIIPVPIKEEPRVDIYWIYHKNKQSVAIEAFTKELELQILQYQRWKSF